MNKDKKTKTIVNEYNKQNKKIPSDVLGSYTGMSSVGEDESVRDEKPVQDADDL
ncbi:MAG: hypothetical protein LBL91_06465 [Lachnospiraceae bacterium]|nr:hypothetical protein [Lachnospiraceae bacterium]